MPNTSNPGTRVNSLTCSSYSLLQFIGRMDINCINGSYTDWFPCMAYMHVCVFIDTSIYVHRYTYRLRLCEGEKRAVSIVQGRASIVITLTVL